MACGCLAVPGLAAKKLYQGRRGLCLAATFFLETFGQNDPIVLVQVALNAALGALASFAFLPKVVGGMSLVWFAVGFIDATAVNEGWENAFIGLWIERLHLLHFRYPVVS